MSRPAPRKKRQPNQPRKPPKAASRPEEPPTAQQVRLPSALPWVGVVSFSVLLIDHMLPNTWIYAWTQEHQPAWAKAVFFWALAVAGVMFVHAYFAAQLRTTMDDADESDRQAIKEIYRTTGSFATAGALYGVLMTMTAAPSPEGIKQTALASDLVMVGTVVGMALASPILAVYSWRAVKRIRTRHMFTYVIRYGFVLAVIDGGIALKLLGWL